MNSEEVRNYTHDLQISNDRLTKEIEALKAERDRLREALILITENYDDIRDGESINVDKARSAIANGE